jgi:hypothetical protein
MAVVIFWIVIGVLFVSAVILLSGRGGFMIAGYNTASPEEKRRYDQKKLTRSVGIALLVIDIATVPLVFVHSPAYIIFYSVFLVVSVLALLAYVNTKCFVPGAPGKKVNKAVFAVIAIVTLVIIAGSVFLVGGGAQPPVYTLSPDSSAFTIDSMYGLTVNTSDIQSLELKATLPSNLKRTNGYGGVGTVLKGFCSSDIGDVRVLIDTSKSLFLYITTSSEVIILNGETNEETQQLYETLNMALKK